MSLQNEIIDYKDNIDDIEHWTLLKGNYRYERIIAFMQSKKIPCTWENVTNYIKYDKRILINSFKYLVFLEEFYKSVLSRMLSLPENKIINAGFTDTLNQFSLLDDKVNFENMDLDLLSTENLTVVQFRNSVCHNKILLDRKYNEKDLEQTLFIILRVLPESYRKGFAKDINGCSKGLVDSLYHIELEYEDK